MGLFAIALLGVGAAIVVWAIAVYNTLVRKRNMVAEGWSGIETQLKRRANLIPNLVETVKGYAGHEQETLEKLTELRSASLAPHSVAGQAETETQITRALGSIMAVAEAYPDLKANENFKDLQDDLDKVETEIQLSRRYYNGTVRDFNTLIEQFPSNLIAGQFGFTKAEFFEIEDAADRAVPQVDFS